MNEDTLIEQLERIIHDYKPAAIAVVDMPALRRELAARGGADLSEDTGENNVGSFTGRALLLSGAPVECRGATVSAYFRGVALIETSESTPQAVVENMAGARGYAIIEKQPAAIVVSDLPAFRQQLRNAGHGELVMLPSDPQVYSGPAVNEIGKPLTLLSAPVIGRHRDVLVIYAGDLRVCSVGEAALDALSEAALAAAASYNFAAAEKHSAEAKDKVEQAKLAAERAAGHEARRASPAVQDIAEHLYEAVARLKADDLSLARAQVLRARVLAELGVIAGPAEQQAAWVTHAIRLGQLLDVLR